MMQLNMPKHALVLLALILVIGASSIGCSDGDGAAIKPLSGQGGPAKGSGVAAQGAGGPGRALSGNAGTSGQ